VNYYQPKCIIELGTSVGISSICMALANKKAVVHTIEGNKQVMEIAMEYAQSINIHSINFYHGMFDEVLPKLLLTVQTPEFVFIDGNHTYEATLKYYKYFKKYVQKGILVFDDIYWSAEMKKAWMAIMEDAVITIDLYKLGIVVIDEMLTPGNYRVRY
jgi:predicted O-methyltransferase YrrM